MNEPLGRDRLGRLVYLDDFVSIDSGCGVVLDADDDGICFKFVFGGVIVLKYHGSAEHVIVDFAASPKRSNFERYFADLGTMDDVLLAQKRICLSVSGFDCVQGDCVFGSWCNSDWLGYDSFMAWLQQEATV